ncbi:hypothetical protein FRC07_000821, partial [Ceratobasidium sp. 392]
MAHGPCGPQFREAFSCFVYSNEEPKGVDCVEKFKAMQDCFREHPDVYGEEIDDEDEDEVTERSEKPEIPSSESRDEASPSTKPQDTERNKPGTPSGAPPPPSSAPPSRKDTPTANFIAVHTMSSSAALKAFEIDSGNYVGNYSPGSVAIKSNLQEIPSYNLEDASPVSSGTSNVNLAMEFAPPSIHKEFRTFIYAFTWEDPREDMKHLKLDSDSSVLVVSSAGDNALHYAIGAGPRRIHCVDMNPCGWALRITKWTLWLEGVLGDARRMCNVDTIEEQEHIWREKLRPVLLNNWFVRLVLNNPAFLWNALGVPLAQRRAFLKEGSCFEFARDTLDPLPSTAVLKDGGYHYLLCLLGKYTPESCPAYLTKEGFEKLMENNWARLDSFRLHTESIT